MSPKKGRPATGRPSKIATATAKRLGPFAPEHSGSRCHWAAREYAAHGWAVLPIAPAGKRPLNFGGCRAAGTAPAVIDGWWARWPAANVGIATGAVSGIAVLDVDGELGRRSLAELETRHGVLPGTISSVTARGVHIFYAHVDGLGIGAGRYGPGLDHRGDGGYVVVPPSVHPSGHVYTWLDAADDPAPWSNPLPAWPAAQLPLGPPRDPAPLPRTPVVCTRRDGRRGPLRGLVQTVLDAPKGQRNTTLNWAAHAAGRHLAAGRLDRTNGFAALLAAAQAVGLTEREAVGTIASGLRAGARS